MFNNYLPKMQYVCCKLIIVLMIPNSRRCFRNASKEIKNIFNLNLYSYINNIDIGMGIDRFVEDYNKMIRRAFKYKNTLYYNTFI